MVSVVNWNIPEYVWRQADIAAHNVTRQLCQPIGPVCTGLNQSMQHSDLLAEMECGHEAATAHRLFCGSAI